MKFRALRPVGEPLPPVTRDADPSRVVPPGYEAIFVQSGTAALALALKVAAEQAGPGRDRVLLPGYGCPDLVAATVFAGLEPWLVDTAPDSPFLSLEALAARLDERVLAVVGVHFLGLAEDIPALRERCDPLEIAVIEDSAQKVPGAGGIGPAADLVVLSFGRGKPAGALGGGALLLRSGTIDMESALRHVSDSPGRTRWIGLRRLAYNTVIRPGPYALVSRLPGLELGVTRYQALEGIRELDAQLRDCALSGWTHAPRTPETSQEVIRRYLEKRRFIYDLPPASAQGRSSPLIRYPVLVATPAQRDKLYAVLSERGASKMYGAALADLPGVPVRNEVGLENARSFAGRFFTLPIHCDVRDTELNEMASIIARYDADELSHDSL